MATNDTDPRKETAPVHIATRVSERDETKLDRICKRLGLTRAQLLRYVIAEIPADYTPRRFAAVNGAKP